LAGCAAGDEQGDAHQRLCGGEDQRDGALFADGHMPTGPAAHPETQQQEVSGRTTCRAHRPIRISGQGNIHREGGASDFQAVGYAPLWAEPCPS
jgi:hypothetical protein